MNLFLPGHELVSQLQHSPEQRRSVWRANVDGQPCVTRILHVPVDPALEVVIRRAALEGRGRLSGLHRDLEAVLEGYQTLAGLRDLPGLPRVIAAGLALDAADPGVGYPYVSVGWAEGETLDALLNRGVLPARIDGLLVLLLELLDRLAARGVAFGDVKPSNFVLSPAGLLQLIDPDTLRRIPDDPGFVVVHDRTPGWAPPELMAIPPRLSLSSDVYSFGLLVCQAWTGARPGQPGFSPELLPGRWRPLVERCLNADPTARPSAARLLAALSEPDAPLTPVFVEAEATTRVPEPAPTPSPAAPVAAPTAPAPKKARAGLRLIPGGLMGLALLAGAGAGARAVILQREADRAAALVWRDLRIYKTEWSQNTDANLSRIAQSAADVVSIWPTPDALGLQALVDVWSERWHYVASARPWDAAAFDATDARVDAALSAGRSAAALAAKGVLYAGACRKMPEDAGLQRMNRCEEAVGTLAEAEAHSPESWLTLELAWNRVMAISALAQGSSPSRARDLRRLGLAVCTGALPRLADAPVNGWYMASECLELAGALDEVPTFLVWADWLLDEVQAPDADARGHTRARVARQIARSTHPDCAELPVRRDGLPDLKASSCAGDRADLCRALALAAMGCSSPLWRGCLRPEEGLPWDAVDSAIRAPLQASCPGSYELSDLPSATLRGVLQSWPSALFDPVWDD